jgi:hypothetical protein
MPFLNQEKLVSDMIHFYCMKVHLTKNGLCDSCKDLNDYAQLRLIKCPYGKGKPVCSNCKIHCYKKDYKERIKEVMRFSGPKMIYHKPIAGIKYIIKKKILDKIYEERFVIKKASDMPPKVF